MLVGQSAEHEISILSARNVLEALDRSRFEPFLIGIHKSGCWVAQDPQKLLAGAEDPRLVRVEAGSLVLLRHVDSGVRDSATPDVGHYWRDLHPKMAVPGCNAGIFLTDETDRARRT